MAVDISDLWRDAAFLERGVYISLSPLAPPPFVEFRGSGSIQCLPSLTRYPREQSSTGPDSK